jgi:hypothetical protein
MAPVSAYAGEWVVVSRVGENVREIDASSIARRGNVVSFTARNVFEEKGGYRVGRRDVKYLVIPSRIDCGKRTIATLGTEAYDEGMALITKSDIPNAEEAPISRDSVDERMFDYVCKGK